MFVLMAITAFAIDVSLVLLARHQAQVAADTGALAAAQDLTGGTTDTTEDGTATTDGQTVAGDNDPNASVQVTAPYGGTDATVAQAVVSKSVSLPFASALGLSTTVKATAVAQNNLVVNGSFNAVIPSPLNFIEYCAADGTTGSASYNSCPNANPSLNGWTVYSGGVDLNISSYLGIPGGDVSDTQTLDLVGSCNGTSSTGTCAASGCPSSQYNGGSLNISNYPESADTCQTNGEIYEKLNTVVNGTYTVSFDLSANNYGGPPNKLLSVWVSKYNPTQYGLGDGVATDPGYASVISGSEPVKGTAESWVRQSFTFSAPGSPTYLWFVSNEGCDPPGTTLTGFASDYVAFAPNCDYGAAITDISVTGPNSDNLTQ